MRLARATAVATHIAGRHATGALLQRMTNDQQAPGSPAWLAREGGELLLPSFRCDDAPAKRQSDDVPHHHQQLMGRTHFQQGRGPALSESQCPNYPSHSLMTVWSGARTRDECGSSNILPTGTMFAEVEDRRDEGEGLRLNEQLVAAAAAAAVASLVPDVGKLLLGSTEGSVLHMLQQLRLGPVTMVGRAGS